LGVALALATVTYRFIEVPGRRLIRFFGAGGGVKPAPAAVVDAAG
jgi:peptidoglycan/LPS O-acetylase OafA/YrhL